MKIEYITAHTMWSVQVHKLALLHKRYLISSKAFRGKRVHLEWNYNTNSDWLPLSNGWVGGEIGLNGHH